MSTSLCLTLPCLAAPVYCSLSNIYVQFPSVRGSRDNTLPLFTTIRVSLTFFLSFCLSVCLSAFLICISSSSATQREREWRLRLSSSLALFVARQTSRESREEPLEALTNAAKVAQSVFCSSAATCTSSFDTVVVTTLERRKINSTWTTVLLVKRKKQEQQ